jgi:hypothetical protein
MAIHYSNEPETVTLYVAGNFLVKIYPFTALQTQVYQPASAVSAEDKDVIIAAILHRAEILKSGDKKQIRELMVKTAPGPEQAKQIEQATDEQLNQIIEFFTSFFGDIKEADLRSPDAQWQISGNEAQIKLKSQNGSVTIKAVEIDGKWY